MGPSYLSDLAVDDIFFSKGTCCQLKQDSFDAGLIGESKQTEQTAKKKHNCSSCVERYRNLFACVVNQHVYRDRIFQDRAP